MFFVPSVDAVEEDDGFLVTYLMAGNTSYFVIVDAKKMEEVKRIEIPTRIPSGFHGKWLSKKRSR